MISAATLATALLWALGASVCVWLLLYPARRRSVIGLLASVVLTGTAASLGALLGGMHEMLLPMQHWEAMLGLTVAAGVIATGAAAAAARRLARDNRAVRAAIADLAAGRIPTDSGRPLTTELESLRTELTTTAAALAETRERERALEASRRELVAWVSHDLRTPLAGLRAMSEALEDGIVDEPHVYYKQIAASTERLSAMVDDLFELSRLQAGVTTAGTDQICIADIVSDCVATLAPLARREAVVLSGVGSSAVTVIGSAAQLSRAITNLITNALRHTPSGGQVSVALSQSRDVVRVAVSDECGGIPDDDLPRLFDVGFRGEAARTPDNDAHAGLGLAIAQGIVHAHSGTLTACNVGAGCTFTMSLPLT